MTGLFIRVGHRDQDRCVAGYREGLRPVPSGFRFGLTLLLAAVWAQGHATTAAIGAAEAVAPAIVSAGHSTDALSPEARALVKWAVVSGDPGGRPFAVIDKREARIHVFSGAGRLIDSAWVLLGSARGDDTAPGIGAKKIADILPEERTTPAGRFVTVPGRNASGHPVIWVDYDAAVSMHVVVNHVKSERRLDRLVSPDPAEHRVSYGCINLPPAFFSKVAQPAFSAKGGIVYVLPETRRLAEVFPGIGESGGASNQRH